MNARRVVVCSSFLRKQGSSVFASLQSAGLPSAAGNFLCWHKESHQRNAFEFKSTAGGFDAARIFPLAILDRSENGAHPCAPPYGSSNSKVARMMSKGRTKNQRQSSRWILFPQG